MQGVASSMSKFPGINVLKQFTKTMNKDRNFSSTHKGRDKNKNKLRPGVPEKGDVTPTQAIGFKYPKTEQLSVKTKIIPSKSIHTILPIVSTPTDHKNRNKGKKFPFQNMDEQGLPLLTPKDCFRRVEFASKLLEILEKDPDILDSILFTDEGNFHLTKAQKTSHKTNQANHSPSEDKTLQRKVAESNTLPQIVWSGMTSKHVIGPYFFNSYVTDRSYLKMLRSYLIPRMESLAPNGSIDKCWFQQDGAPPHRSQLVLPFLTKTFGNHLISYGCPIAWPPKSQDLTPLDYFFWDHLKKKLKLNCKDSELKTRTGFRENLSREIDQIDEETLKPAIKEFPIRLEKCVEANGNRFYL